MSEHQLYHVKAKIMLESVLKHADQLERQNPTTSRQVGDIRFFTKAAITLIDDEMTYLNQLKKELNSKIEVS